MADYIKSNRIDLHEFVNNSLIWMDIKNELEVWLQDIRDQLENINGDLSVRVLDRLGGNAESIRNLLALPQIMIDTLDVDFKMDKK